MTDYERHLPPILHDKASRMLSLRGTIGGGMTTNGTTVATLPSGYRPPADLQFAIATTSSSALARMVIRSSGAIQIYNIDVASMSLDGTSFFVD